MTVGEHPPAVGDVARSVMALPEAKRRLVEQFIRERVTRSAGSADTSPANRYKASFPQQELWMAQQLAPDPCMYNMVWRLQLSDSPEPDAIRSALRSVAARHDALRTTFRLENGGVMAEVDQTASVYLDVFDGRHLGETETGKQAASWRAGLQRRPFRLDSEPPMRAGVCLLPQDKVNVFVVVHHIAFDAWSAGLLLKELSAFGHNQMLPDPETTYSEFAAWQHWRAGSEEVRESLAYWRDTLAPVPPPVTIPEDKPRSARPRRRGRRVPLYVDERTVSGLKRRCQEGGATLFTVMLSGYKILLHECTKETDITVGTLASNRTERRFESTIGCFVNPLMLRTEMAEGMSIREVVERVSNTVQMARRHQQVPYQQVLSTIVPARVPGRFPFAQTMFVFQDIPYFGSETADSVERLENGASFFDATFTLNASRDSKSYGGWIEYDVDLYHEETILRAAARFTAVLGIMGEQPDAKLRDLPGSPGKGI